MSRGDGLDGNGRPAATFGDCRVHLYQPRLLRPLRTELRFPVLGTWDVTLRTVTFFDAATGNPVRVVSYLSFDGTLSNPATGKSVPDSVHHPDKITDYFASDGTFLKEVIIESRDDRYLHAAGRFGTDANVNVLFDNGRSWFLDASHVIDLQPLCAALS
jgi:hypothetical protein